MTVFAHQHMHVFLSAVVVVERGGGGASKIKKMNEKEGSWGTAQKPEHFDARKGNGTHICVPPTYGFINKILTPPHLG